MQFKIEPYQIAVTANKLEFKVIGNDDDNATIYYKLTKEDGGLAEEGNKTFPIEALQVIAQKPVNVAALNQLLSQWGITATEQVLSTE